VDEGSDRRVAGRGGPEERRREEDCVGTRRGAGRTAWGGRERGGSRKRRKSKMAEGGRWEGRQEAEGREGRKVFFFFELTPTAVLN
jgi:hypothetical protein